MPMIYFDTNRKVFFGYVFFFFLIHIPFLKLFNSKLMPIDKIFSTSQNNFPPMCTHTYTRISSIPEKTADRRLMYGSKKAGKSYDSESDRIVVSMYLFYVRFSTADSRHNDSVLYCSVWK
jgi:hypothetical protein